MEKQYTFKEVCKLFGITRQTIYNWQKEGKIKVVMINGRPRVPESELLRISKGE